MRSEFFNFYRPPDSWFSTLWESCTFVVDANVILNLYRYSSETSEQLFSTLESVKERIWIPYQAALEYQQRRLDVISFETRTYSETIKQSRMLRENLASSRRHPFANGALVASILGLLDTLENELQQTQTTRDKLFLNDPLQIKVAELFAERVGQPLSDEVNSAIAREGNKRFEERIPPGYRDADKEGVRKFGDLRIWFEILDYAQESKNNVIFITDDAKEDWWHIHSGKIIGPRPELLMEIKQKANIMFYMYQPSYFMELAQSYLNRSVKRETIDEIKNISSMHLIDVDYSLENELVNQIPRRYKAFRRFVQSHKSVKQIVNLYFKYDFTSHDVEDDPASVPNEFWTELEATVRSEPEAVTAIQAIHSLSPTVIQQHASQLELPDETLSDAYLANQLSSAFIRVIAVMRDEGRLKSLDPRIGLETYLRQRYTSMGNKDDREES